MIGEQHSTTGRVTGPEAASDTACSPEAIGLTGGHTRLKSWRWTMVVVFLVMAMSALAQSTSRGLTPPLHDTPAISENLITGSDPTVFDSMRLKGQVRREIYDERKGGSIHDRVYLFSASFKDGQVIEMHVNSEFDNADDAEVAARKYAVEVGRLPNIARSGIKTIVVNKGDNYFTADTGTITIYTGNGESLELDGLLQEVLLHEAVHATLDREHSRARGWLEAQSKDRGFISKHARNNPVSEDVAETFVAYFAVAYRSDRIGDSYVNMIMFQIPHRMEYLNNQDDKGLWCPVVIEDCPPAVTDKMGGQ